MKTIELFTDGSCSGNPGPGGWGVVVVDENKITKFSGRELSTTNNRMELTAAIKALESARKDESLYLYTDSTYLQKGITEWITSSKKPVKNKDQWTELDKLNSTYKIKWRWIKSHQESNSKESEFNNLADALAREAII